MGARADVFVEQVSHHPPISSWEVVDQKRKVRGSCDQRAFQTSCNRQAQHAHSTAACRLLHEAAVYMHCQAAVCLGLPSAGHDLHKSPGWCLIRSSCMRFSQQASPPNSCTPKTPEQAGRQSSRVTQRCRPLQYKFYGNANWSASARGNSIKGQQGGLNSVWFASDGAVVSWTLPPLHLRGRPIITLTAHCLGAEQCPYCTWADDGALFTDAVCPVKRCVAPTLGDGGGQATHGASLAASCGQVFLSVKQDPCPLASHGCLAGCMCPSRWRSRSSCVQTWVAGPGRSWRAGALP